MTDYNKTKWINNETVVDADKLNKLENQMHLMTASSNTNAQRLADVEDLVDTKIEDVSTNETDDGTVVKFIANGEVVQEVLVQGGNSVKIQSDAPTNPKALWVDVDDENVDSTLSDSLIIDEFREKLNIIKQIVDKFNYLVTGEMDAGYFDKDYEYPHKSKAKTKARNCDCDLPPLLQGDSTDKEEDFPEWLDVNAPQINTLKIRRGNKDQLTNLQPTLKEAELGFCLDTEELYIGNKGMPRLLAKVGGMGGGSGSLTGKYLELEANDGEKFRITVNEDGQLHVLPNVADTSTEPPKEEASRYKGLIIRHVYGGGKKNCNFTLCSHGFIELYNNTKFALNLNGLSVQYATNGEPWEALPLRGIIKPYHSFLIRCAEHTDMNKPTVKLKIRDFDMHWDIPISDKSIKVYLGVGKEAIVHPNPFNINDAGMKEPGYIDLFAVGGITEYNGVISKDFPIDACENNYGYIISKNISAERVTNTDASAKTAEFQDTDDNFKDIRGVDLRNAITSIHTPRPSSYGHWNTYYDKMILDDVPQMINLGYGEDGDTTRTFTWQTTPTKKGCIMYKKKGSEDWITVISNKKNVTHPDTDATVHSAIIHGFTPGKWVYKVGSTARWSDEYEFDVKTPTTAEKISFLQVSDQQGWNEEEYTAWGTVYNEIEKKEKFDFIINPGDISQNGGGRAFEWRYYYDFAPSIPTRCHMTTCGNNDLTYNPETDKKEDPTAFTWYSTVENAPYISCHSWNYGYCHFVCINSNVMTQDSEIATQQVEWLKQDLAKPENQKRWKIVYMHEPVYSHVRSKILECFITPFAEGGVDLVIGGHHHRYTRSKRMGALGPNKENVESPTGFYTVMGNGSGAKLSGKTAPHDNNHEYMEVYNDKKDPNYITWDITYDRIDMKSYKVYNVVPIEDNIGNIPDVRMFDSLTITK